MTHTSNQTFRKDHGEWGLHRHPTAAIHRLISGNWLYAYTRITLQSTCNVNIKPYKKPLSLILVARSGARFPQADDAPGGNTVDTLKETATYTIIMLL